MWSLRGESLTNVMVTTTTLLLSPSAKPGELVRPGCVGGSGFRACGDDDAGDGEPRELISHNAAQIGKALGHQAAA